MRWTLKHCSNLLKSNQVEDKIVSHYAFDSRHVKAGSLFFALQGERHDGHAYLQQVSESGAVGAVVSHQYKGESYGLELIYVNDPLTALGDLARFRFLEMKIPAIGITGSVGKTTTKEFAKTVLSQSFKVATPKGSQNSKVSMPAFLLNIDTHHGYDFILLEMGASDPGDLDYLLSIAPLDYALLTHISHSHTQFFGGIHGVAQEKQKILMGPYVKGRLISEDAAQHVSVNNLELTTYAVDSAQSTLSLNRLKGGYQIRAHNDYTPLFDLPLSEEHFLENFTAVFGLARMLGMNFDDILEGAQKLKPYAHRFQRVEKEGCVFIDDSYNASVASFMAAFRALPKRVKGQKIGIFGAMKELGDYTEEAHKIVAQEALKHFDEVHCIGEECFSIVELFQKNNKTSKLYNNLQELETVVEKKRSKGDLFLLKGSNSYNLWELLEQT